MHDPMTVIRDFPKYPRTPIITLWHVDPEKDGSDDSCDWFNHKAKLGPREKALEEALWDLEHLLDNKPHWPDSREHRAFQPVSAACRAYLHAPSRTHWWQLHPRWHIHHWRVQVHPWEKLRRFLLTRCCRCGGRFPWGATVYTDAWDSPRPRFLRGEVGVYHADCRNPKTGHFAQCASAP